MLAGLYMLISVISFMFLAGCEPGVYRDGHRGYSGADNRGYDRGDRHYYRDGRWYKHDAQGNEIAVDALAVGAFIEVLPPQHTTVVIQGAPYYHDDRYYYRQTLKGGYTVVSPPVADQDTRREHR